jgi:uncharacterized membrane protein YdjX (TVP38/TMEM64 family)
MMTDSTSAEHNSAEAAGAAEVRKRSTFKRLLPLVALLAVAVGAYALGLQDYISFEALRANRQRLLDLVAAYPFLAPLAFTLLYAVVIALSVPGGAVLTMTGGFLFGVVLGVIAVVIGATLGATAVFLIAKTALGDPLRAKAGPWLRRMEAGFRANAFNYLLVLRLIPLFPFWLVNLVPAFLGVPLGTYALATLLGIIPGSLVYASVGNGLGAVFDRGETPDLGIIFEPQILGPILGLAALALLPVLYRKYKARRTAS